MKKISIEKIEDLILFNYLEQNAEYIVTLKSDLDFENPDSYRYNEGYSNRINGLNISPIDLKNVSVIFDGDFHEIKNLKINMPFSNDIGMFNTYENTNFAIKDLIITNAQVRGNNNVGIIGGTFNGTLNNTVIEGNVCGNEKVGGIVGLSTKRLTLNNVRSDVEITANKSGIIVGEGKQILANSCMFNAENYHENQGLVYLCDKLDILGSEKAYRKVLHKY